MYGVYKFAIDQDTRSFADAARRQLLTCKRQEAKDVCHMNRMGCGVKGKMQMFQSPICRNMGCLQTSTRNFYRSDFLSC